MKGIVEVSFHSDFLKHIYLTMPPTGFFHQDAPELVVVEPGVQVTSELAILMATAMSLGETFHHSLNFIY